MNEFVGPIVSWGSLFYVMHYLGFHALGQHYRWGCLSDLRLGQAAFLSVWHLTAGCWSNALFLCIWGSCNSILIQHFDTSFSVILLIAIDINTIFFFFGTLLLAVQNGCWHWIRIGCACISGYKVRSNMDCCRNRI